MIDFFLVLPLGWRFQCIYELFSFKFLYDWLACVVSSQPLMSDCCWIALLPTEYIIECTTKQFCRILKAFLYFIQLTSVQTSWMPIEFMVFCSWCLRHGSFLLLLLQKVKTSVQKKNPNPVWNEVLQLTVTNPTKPVHLVGLLSQLVHHVCYWKNI
jgi:hypothetical protein